MSPTRQQAAPLETGPAGHKATSLCTVIAFFCCEAHLDAWCQTDHPGTDGHRLTLGEAMQVGRALFAPVFRAANDAIGRTHERRNDSEDRRPLLHARPRRVLSHGGTETQRGRVVGTGPDP